MKNIICAMALLIIPALMLSNLAMGQSGPVALLIEDQLPWGVNSNEQALTALGIPYDVITSALLASTDLSQYKFIMYASDQPASFYDNIHANMQKITDYVSAGGVLIAHCGSDNWNGEMIFPGDNVNTGQMSLHHWNDQPPLPPISSQDIQITDPNNPVADGLTDDRLSNIQDGPTATLGTIAWPNPAALGTGVDIVMIAENSPGFTYIDYNYGPGKVMATMQSIEWQYAGHGGTTKFLNNEIGYAFGYAMHTPPIYVSTVQYGATLQAGPYTPVNEGIYLDSASLPADQFIGYEIGLTAESIDANLVMVTDKLPPGVTYVGTYRDNGNNQPDLTHPIDQTTDPTLITWPTTLGNMASDTVTVQISSIPKCTHTKFWIVTRLNSLTDNPQILYNNVFVRAANSDANLFKETKLVIEGDYNRFEAAKSCEFLLKNQTHLLLSFEDLLHGVTQAQASGVTVNKTAFLLSFEQLLDQQGTLLDNFQSILYKKPGSGEWYWDGSEQEQGEIRIDFLLSYEELLKKEAYLFSSFNDVLTKPWPDEPTDAQKKEFASSFEKLLHTEMGLYGSYDNLTKQLDLVDNTYYIPKYVPASIQNPDGTPYNPSVGLRGLEWRIVFLGSFENLLRLQSSLLSGFEGIVKELITPPEVLLSPQASAAETVTKAASANESIITGATNSSAQPEVSNSGRAPLTKTVTRVGKGASTNESAVTADNNAPAAL